MAVGQILIYSSTESILISWPYHYSNLQNNRLHASIVFSVESPFSSSSTKGSGLVGWLQLPLKVADLVGFSFSFSCIMGEREQKHLSSADVPDHTGMNE